MSWILSPIIGAQKSIKKLLKLASYESGNFKDGDGNTIVIDNTTSPYIAFADDDAGTGFTMTANSTSAYLAIKFTEVPLDPPVAGDFTGLWWPRLGVDGIDGTDGADGLSVIHGTGAPDNALGVNDQYYIDDTAKALYGPKVAGAWPAAVSMIGPAGQNAYEYRAFASDATGTAFTTSDDPQLAYTAVISTTTEIPSPVAGDFAGLWYKRTGTDGAAGAPGVPGIGYLYKYNTSTSGDPTPGFIRLNNASVDLVTNVYIDFFAQNSIDLSAWLAIFQIDGKIYIRSSNSTDGSFAIYSIDTITAQASHYVFGVTYVAGNPALDFTSNEDVVLAYTDIAVGDGPVTSSEVLAADDFARFTMSGTDVTGFKDPSGNTLYGINPSYVWGVDMPDPTTMPLWASVVVDPSSFAGTHKAPTPVRAVTDQVHWMPEGGSQLLFRAAARISAALATASGATATKFNVAVSPRLPADFFTYIGAGLRVAAIFRKTGGDTNTSNFSIRYGKFDSTASEIVATESTTTTHTDKEIRIETRMSITALGAAGVGVMTTNSLGINTGGGETGSALDRTAQIATDALSYVVFTAHCANNAAATHELLYYEVWWEA